ncbi:MAG: Hint domain-containing protein, partial [Pseudomonadota bacterium]
DRLWTATNQLTTVRWVGVQTVDTRLSNPIKDYPVQIKASAFGTGLPSRDLFVSPDHAIFVDGMLISASALVNGRTIFQVDAMPLPGFRYFHVMTDAHEVLLAEALPVESYIDYVDDRPFENSEERPKTPMAEMEFPRVSAKRQVPVRLRKLLEERAAKKGIVYISDWLKHAGTGLSFKGIHHPASREDVDLQE